jgi:translation initiation factor 1 (eIF-1/SUI1)
MKQTVQNEVVEIQGDQKFSVHLMITIQKVTNNVQSVPRQSPGIY